MAADQQSIPTPALLLGLGGLIPFVSSAVLVWTNLPLDQWLPVWIVQQREAHDLATLALAAYGAIILSFLGGVRWGNLLFSNAELHHWMPLTMSVVPSLIAWPALFLSPVPMLALLCGGFILQYALDLAAGKRGVLPAWFLRLRLVLTLGAVASLLCGLTAHALR